MCVMERIVLRNVRLLLDIECVAPFREGLIVALLLDVMRLFSSQLEQNFLEVGKRSLRSSFCVLQMLDRARTYMVLLHNLDEVFHIRFLSVVPVHESREDNQLW